MKLYHASNHDITTPDEKEHARNLRSIINGNSVLGLFCNTDPQGSHVYGDKLYSFTLAKGAEVLELNDQLRQAGRCAEYYRGIRDVLLELGYDAIKVTYEGGMAVVVLNFNCIREWTLEGDAP